MDQTYIIQMRGPELNMSSMLPAKMIAGMADMRPVTNRPTMMAAIDRTAPTRMQKSEKINVDTTYNHLRPKDSENGGNSTPPTACPIK